MKIIKPGYEILRPQRLDDATRTAVYTAIEAAGRTCYKSERAITPNSAAGFVKNLISRGHEAMLEHASMTVRFTVDRGVSHEIVRHRIASYAQESTRYCNYSENRFGSEITFIKPCFFMEDSPSYNVWITACARAEEAYFDLLDIGETPERARTVLPNSLKTEIVVTMDMREWRHFFKLRAIGTTGSPHPRMKEVAYPLFRVVSEWAPELFGDIVELIGK